MSENERNEALEDGYREQTAQAFYAITADRILAGEEWRDILCQIHDEVEIIVNGQLEGADEMKGKRG